MFKCFASKRRSLRAALKREDEVTCFHPRNFRGIFPESRINVGRDAPKRGLKWKNIQSVDRPSDIMTLKGTYQFKSIRYAKEVDDGCGNAGGRFRELHIGMRSDRVPYNHLWLEIPMLPLAVKRVYLNFPSKQN